MIDVINTLITLYGLGVYFFYVASTKTRNHMAKTPKENRYFDLKGKEITSDDFYYNESIYETGSMILWNNGDKEYRKYHMAHKLDGPAVEYVDGRVEYWIDGVRIPEEQFKLLLDIMKLKGLL